MRRTASEIVRDLEIRIARLENKTKKAHYFDDDYQNERKHDLEYIFKIASQDMVYDGVTICGGKLVVSDYDFDAEITFETTDKNEDDYIVCSLDYPDVRDFHRYRNELNKDGDLDRCEIHCRSRRHSETYYFSLKEVSVDNFTRQIKEIATKFFEEEVNRR